MKRIILLLAGLMLVLAGCGQSYTGTDQGLAPSAPPAPKPSAETLLELDTNDQGQTLHEVRLPDGTKCMIVSYDTGIGTDCEWGK